MKSIKLTLTMLCVLTFTAIHAQDDFYHQKKKNPKEKVEQKKAVKMVGVDQYLTEQDYNEKHNIVPAYEVVEDWNRELYEEKEPEKKRRNNSVAVEIIAEVVVEVFINAAFIVAAFWH